MHPAIVFRVLGLLSMIFSLTHLPPLLVAFYYDDGGQGDFFTSLLLTFILGLSLYLPFNREKRDLMTRDCFIIVTMFWLVLALLGTVPLLLSPLEHLSFTDAFFESMSGLTTTGATILTGLDELPPSLLWYRQQLQWLGGLGIIAIAVAILPMLGIGGMQLYRAESPGPVKDSKVLPRVTQTAKALLFIYVGLTTVCALVYKLFGMSWFDALTHSFTTISIGGFSTHDASFAYFDSELLNYSAVFFMFLAGINFSLHFGITRTRRLADYWQDSELRAYTYILLAGCIVTFIVLVDSNTYGWREAFNKSLFEVVSIATTTGFGLDDFSSWPHFLPFFLFYMAIIGACAGSTGGGMKVIRVLLIFKQGLRELERLVHPHAVLPVKLGVNKVPDRVLEAVWGFFSVYILVYMILLMLLLAAGLDITTAFTAVGAMLNNLGPGLGDVAANYASLPDTAKWLLTFGMLLGRLEIFTLLVLFSPMFWRK
jgi:trk system potassium uptake protein TrkH